MHAYFFHFDFRVQFVFYLSLLNNLSRNYCFGVSVLNSSIIYQWANMLGEEC